VRDEALDRLVERLEGTVAEVVDDEEPEDRPACGGQHPRAEVGLGWDRIHAGFDVRDAGTGGGPVVHEGPSEACLKPSGAGSSGPTGERAGGVQG